MFQSYLAYNVNDIGLNPNNIRTGNTFDVSLSDTYDFIVTDGDTSASSGPDPEGDEFVYIQDSAGNVVTDGESFFLETVITFTIGGVEYTGYYFESATTGQDYIVFSDPVPAGTATVTSVNKNPGSVEYSQLTSADETVAEGNFEFLNLGGDDTISTGAGNDTVEADWGSDLVYGGAGNDTISGEGGADTLFGDAGDDSLSGGLGADVIDGGTGNDIIDGGSADDILTGGDGDDIIYGGSAQTATFDRIGVEWNQFTDPDGDGRIDNGDDLSGQTQSVGAVDVSISTSAPGITAYANTTLLTTGVDGGTDTVTPSSAMGLENDGTTQISFSEGVENLQFRISDFEGGSASPLEILTIRAYDINGNLITYTVDLGATINGDDTDGVAGADTFYSDLNVVSSDTTPDGSMLVTIPGPVALVEFEYTSQGGSLVVSDMYFDNAETEIDEPGGNDVLDGGAGADTLFGLDGDDTLTGGTGADSLDGGTGNDTITFAEGDQASGGAGDDLFILADYAEATNGPITLTGGGGSETGGGGDTLQLGTLADLSTLNITSTSTNASGNTTYDGTVTLDDGTLLTFSEMENIICFTPGTRIETPEGPRPIEDLKPGDLVDTVDNGPQPIRWIHSTTVPAEGKLAPIHFAAGTLPGQTGDLMVSPQHRMELGNYLTEVLFGEKTVLVPARHFLGTRGVSARPGGMVTYVHMLFDQHEIVISEGCKSESFHPGEMGLKAIRNEARAELLTLFPDLAELPESFGPTARYVVKAHEAALLLSAIRQPVKCSLPDLLTA